MKSTNNAGFALIELIFIIVILGILSSVLLGADRKHNAVSIETKNVPLQNGTTKWE